MNESIVHELSRCEVIQTTIPMYVDVLQQTEALALIALAFSYAILKSKKLARRGIVLLFTSWAVLVSAIATGLLYSYMGPKVIRRVCRDTVAESWFGNVNYIGDVFGWSVVLYLLGLVMLLCVFAIVILENAKRT